LVVLVSEKPNLVSENSGKIQGILFICGAGNPDKKGAITYPDGLYHKIRRHSIPRWLISQNKGQ